MDTSKESGLRGPGFDLTPKGRDFILLAILLGFKWRDKDPSGASSIERYHRWIETKDAAIRQRMIDYNEDDCIAMRVLLDSIQNLSVLTQR